MTTLNHPVRRKTQRAYNVLYHAAKNARPVVVSLLPGDVLEFREHGRRGRWLLSVDTAFRYALRLHSTHP